MTDLKETLQKHWRHSHEEDSATEVVYRPASFSFPPSRGRIGFELKPDGSYVDHGTGPADGPTVAEGTWTLEGNQLNLRCDTAPGGQRTLRVISCDENRLLVER